MSNSDDEEFRDALTDIHGIGDAKAGKIIAVLEQHGPGENPYLPDDYRANMIGEDVANNLRQAADYHDAGDHAYAAKFVRRAADALDDE